MSIKLEDVLAAYSYIDDDKDDPFFSFYPEQIPPEIQNGFETTTFLKKEFNDLKLAVNEPARVPRQAFKPLNPQLFASRFMSPYTPYSKLLLFYQVGVGKTCAASLIAELAKEQNPSLKPALVILKNDVLERSFRREIAEVCTTGKYLPKEMYFKDPTTKRLTPLTMRQVEMRIKAKVSENYRFTTFEKFAKELRDIDPDNKFPALKKDFIERTYSNRYIFIDEAHNLRDQMKESNIDVYNEIHNFLHTVKNTKQILMTATPMRDRAYEIAMLFNLILPLDNQFNVLEFDDDYFTDSGKNFIPSKREEFKQKIRGLVSFVQAEKTSVQHRQQGRILPGMNKVPLIDVVMSDKQTKSYIEGYQIDTKSGKKIEEAKEEDEDEEPKAKKFGLYNSSRQASLFVAPDGKYGDELINDWIVAPKTKSTKKVYNAFKRDVNNQLYRITEDLKTFIYNSETAPSTETKLAKLRELSAIYAGIVQTLLEKPKEKAFVYINMVKGGGLRMFAALLELFGFQHLSLPDPDKKIDLKTYQPPAGIRQYIIITGDFPTNKQATKMVEIFNNPLNMYGDIVQVIVASKKVSEGMSFKQGRQIHIATPWWNMTEIAQADGRVMRAFAHDIFPDDEKYINFFKWCAVPNPKINQNFNVPSINLQMYVLSENKDFPIKQIERLMKETAVDCALNVKRNMVPGGDDSRDCDYSSCLYQCDNIPKYFYDGNVTQQPIPPLITDTYNFLYGESQIEYIKGQLMLFFQNNFTTYLSTLLSLFPDTPMMIVLRALKDLIINSVPIPNKYGFMNYIREEGNMYFLINNSEYKRGEGLYMLSWYSENPALVNMANLDNYSRYYENILLPDNLTELVGLTDDEDLTPSNGYRTLNYFSPHIREQLVESALLANKLGIKRHEEFKDIILSVFKGNYEILESGEIISDALFKSKNIFRCLPSADTEWVDCSDVGVEKFKENKKQTKNKLKTNPYGFYGMIDGGDFKIVSLKEDEFKKDKSENKAKINRGQKCKSGWSSVKTMQSILISMGEIAEQKGVKPPSVLEVGSADINTLRKVTSKQLYDMLVASRNNSACVKYKQCVFPDFTQEQIEAFSPDKKLIWAGIFAAKGDVLCEALKEWFANTYVDDKPLLVIS